MSRMTVLEGYHCCSTEVIEARAQGIPRPPITLLVDGPSIVTLQKAVWKQSLAMVEWGQSELVNCMVPTCSYIKAAASWRKGGADLLPRHNKTVPPSFSVTSGFEHNRSTTQDSQHCLPL